MQKYESKQVRINRPAAQIYDALSDFSRFTPLVQDKVEDWNADRDTCSFKAQGFRVRLRIVERDEPNTIKIVGDDGFPFDFMFWMQLKEVDPSDTRMRLVLHVELNMMMKMMIGSKLHDALDKIADQIAFAFNSPGSVPDNFEDFLAGN